MAWSRFDANTGATQAIGSPTSGRDERVQAPSDLPQSNGAYVKASISAVDGPHRSWATPVDAYFRRAGSAWQLVGVERLPNTPAAAPLKE